MILQKSTSFFDHSKNQRKYYYLSSTFSFRNMIMIVIILILFEKPTVGQVYNYIPLNYRDFETNPSILASGNNDKTLQFIHQNAFATGNPIFLNSLRFTKYFESAFLGMGFSLNNTNSNDNINYYHFGLGIGYRNVLFNKLFIKLGATYKLVYSNSPSGEFDYYSFRITDSIYQKNFKDNLNLALSLSTTLDRYYISFGVQNIDLPWNLSKSDIQFPTYYVLNIGNLMSLFDDLRSEISYTAFFKSSKITDTISFSQYINLKFHVKLNRHSGLNYGAKIGYAEYSYFHLIPVIKYYREKLAIDLSYNFHIDKKTFHSKYYSTIQLGLIYIL